MNDPRYLIYVERAKWLEGVYHFEEGFVTQPTITYSDVNPLSLHGKNACCVYTLDDMTKVIKRLASDKQYLIRSIKIEKV